MTKPTFYAVFEWTNRENGWYDLADAVGSRVFKTERGARDFKLKVEKTSCTKTERGYVVRDSNYARQKGGIVITPAGRITMTIPCTCPLPNTHLDNRCPYHFGTSTEHVFTPAGAAYPENLYCHDCGASETDHRL